MKRKSSLWDAHNLWMSLLVVAGLLSAVILYRLIVAPHRSYDAVDPPTPEFYKRLAADEKAADGLETPIPDDVSSLEMLPRIVVPFAPMPPEEEPAAPPPTTDVVLAAPPPSAPPLRRKHTVPHPQFKPTRSLSEGSGSNSSTGAFLAAPKETKKEKEEDLPQPQSTGGSSAPAKSRDWRTPTGYSSTH